MIDVSILRDNPDLLRRSFELRGVDTDVGDLSDLEKTARNLGRQAEEARAEQNRASKRIASLEGAEKQQAIDAARTLATNSKALSERAEEAEAAFQRVWIDVPNLVADDAAPGLTEEDNVEIKRVGDPPSFSYEAVDHQELGEELGIIDMERAAKVSGTRFAFLKGQAVLLEFALVRWALDQMEAAGFTPVVPPVLVREDALFGTGFFPGDREQVYALTEDDLFLVGTSEVSLAAMHSDEILDSGDLPIRYAGFSTCFRRESGTYGKDTRGIFRVHQFDKVEMFSFVKASKSPDEHERILQIEEEIFTALEIPYRVVNVAAGDLGASAAKKYDIEAWVPSQNRYREITSCSNTTDFQSRRLKIRRRLDKGTELVHTLNGTAVAIPRTILAIMENNQQDDGSVVIPEILHPYTGFERIAK